MAPAVQAGPGPHSRSEVSVGGAVWCCCAVHSVMVVLHARLDVMVGAVVS